MSGQKRLLKYVPECQKPHLREFKISKFSRGAIANRAP